MCSMRRNANWAPSMRPRDWLLGLSLYLFALAGSPVALAQMTSGTISGLVLDEIGGAVPEATVNVRNLETNASFSITTQDDGRFNFSGLPVGRYEITAERAGFAKYVRGPVNLVLNQVAMVTLELRPAPLKETVRVTEDVSMLDTITSEVGVRFDEKRLRDLPTLPSNGAGFRDVFAFALSAPGVTQLNSGNASLAAGTNFSVNGIRVRGNNFTIDGQDSNNPSVSGPQQVMNNPEVVQEFRLLTNQFSAEYGHSAGSVVNVITKSGTNHLHGSAFWFHNDNALNSRSNLDKSAGFLSAPFRLENQFGGTVGGPIWRDHTFFFASLQRWTDRQLGSGSTIQGVPTEAGRQLLQQLAGSRPQVQALLKHLPAAQFPLGTSVPLTVGSQTVQIPVGSLTNSARVVFNDWQWSGRIDHRFGKNALGGRYLFDTSASDGMGQATPPGLTTANRSRSQSMSLFLTSNLSPRTLNDLRVSWERLGTDTSTSNPEAEEIPSIEIEQLGLTGHLRSPSRTAIGAAVELPNSRFNNTYQVQETIAWNRGPHMLKFGIDFRHTNLKTFFSPGVRGLLRYPTLQRFVDDNATALLINKPLPGGQTTQYLNWDDYFLFAQDTWAVRPSLTLNYGLRYELPGNAAESLYAVNDRIMQTNGGNEVFRLSPRPKRDTNNFQPRVGFSWNPRTRSQGTLSWLTGSDKLVLRGGYSRTNDYAFIMMALQLSSSFPFVASINKSNLANAFTLLPALQPDLSNPASLNLLKRTTVAGDFRSPIAEQFSLEVQRALASATVLRVGYIGTKGTALFQTIDGNPRTICAMPPNCPRVDPTRGVIRLRANAASSIYHSLQISMDRRFARGFSAGLHYTWSAFIDTASDIFNPSVRGEVAVAQDSFNRGADRGRSTYDRPHRFAANFIWELPVYRHQQGVLGHLLGGWQIGSFVTFQSGSPFTPLNGDDPAGALAGIDAEVGDAIRPNLNTTLNVSKMSIQELLAAGGASLFRQITAAERVGNAGRNILRSDGIANIDFSILKSTRMSERHQLQFRVDMFNMTNTRNFGIPESRINNPGFLNQWGTDGGNRRIFLSLRYAF